MCSDRRLSPFRFWSRALFASLSSLALASTIAAAAEPAVGRDCRFEIPGDQTIAREMLRLLLSGGLAPGVESNRCLLPARFLKLRTPRTSPGEEGPHALLIPYEKSDTVKILEVKPIPAASPAEERVRFVLTKANGKRYEDEFSMMLYRSPKLQLLMGCAELLDPPKHRFYPASSSDCP